MSTTPSLEKLLQDSGLAEKAQVLEANLVRLRYFAGLPHQQAADALGISRATADRYWAYAKAFLRCEMEDADLQ